MYCAIALNFKSQKNEIDPWGYKKQRDSKTSAQLKNWSNSNA